MTALVSQNYKRPLYAVSAFTIAALLQAQPSNADAYISSSMPRLTHEFGLCVSDKANAYSKAPTLRLSRAEGFEDRWFISVFEAEIPQQARRLMQEDTSHNIQGVQLFNIMIPQIQDNLEKTTLKRYFPLIEADSYLGLFQVVQEGQNTPIETISCHIPQLKL